MPALPDRAGRPLPDTTDVVVIGGGYTGINAARELARRGVGVTLLEAKTLGWGASTRNGGIVHAGYKWSPRELIERYGEATGRGALPRDARRLRDRQATGRRGGDRLRLPRGRPPRARLRRRRTWPELEHAQASLASVGVEASTASRASASARRSARTPTTGRSSCRAARCSTPAGTSPAWPPRRIAAGADLHEGVRARTIRRQARRPVRGRDGPRRRSWPATSFVATNGYTDGVAPTLRRRIIPIGSYIIASEPLPEDLARDSRPKGRAFFDTKNFLYYWHVSADRRMVFGGRASIHADVDRPDRRRSCTAACSRSTRSWPAAGSSTPGAATSASRFDRMPHVGRTSDGVAYAMGCCGTGVALMTHLGTKVGEWLAGGEAPALAQPEVPARAGAVRGPAVVPAVGRRVVPAQGSARRAVAVRDEDRLPDVAAEHRLGQPRRGLGRGRPARRLRFGLAQRPPDRSRTAIAAGRASRR